MGIFESAVRTNLRRGKSRNKESNVIFRFFKIIDEKSLQI